MTLNTPLLNWVCLGSADPKQKHAGAIVWIRKSLTNPEDIKYETVIPGRIMRVRFPIGQQYISMIIAYQHAWNLKDHKLTHKRHTFWQALDSCTRKVPQREWGHEHTGYPESPIYRTSHRQAL